MKKFSIFFLVLFFVFVWQKNSLYAVEELKSYTLAGVSVEGNKFADPETIIALSGLTVGSKISYPYDDKINSAIRNLWQRKQFSDIDIVVDRFNSQGIYLSIKVKEFPRLSYINVENNDKVKNEEIIKAVGKQRGDIVSNYDLYLAKNAIKKLYDEEGLIFAKVELELISSDTASYARIRVYVDEGSTFYVSKIEFEGNSYFSNSQLASAFDDTKTKSWWQIWKSSKFDKIKYEKDLELLKRFFKKEGFINASIIKDTLIYHPEKQEVEVHVKITEGKRVYVKSIHFEGNTVFSEDQLLKRIEFKAGDKYDVEKFDQNLLGNQDQTDASGLYNNSGYLTARLEKEEKRIAEDSVEIRVNVFENDRFRIRRVEIIGNTKTKEKVIRRELFTRPGDYFDKSAIINSVKAISVLNYFNPESLKPDVKPVPGDNTAVDVIYKVEERSTDTFNASVGFAGSFGLTGSIGFTFNNFALSDPFSGGGGEIFNFNWEFGQASRFQSFSIGYTQPWLNDRPVTLGFNIFDSKINYGYQLRRTGASVNIGRRLSWPDNYFRIDGSLRTQVNDVGESAASTYYRAGVHTEITPSFSISRANINSPFFPTSGSRFNISSSWAMGSLKLGSVDYLKTEMSLDFYNPLMRIGDNERMVFFMGAKMGYVTGLANDTTISPIELYRMGGNGLSGFGVTPLRGYTDQSIEKTGGKLMSRYLAELRFAVSLDPMPIYIYGFAEAGNVWSSFKNTDPFDLKRSAGFGIQMFLNPIGIIGFSYGYGFDQAPNSVDPPGWKFLFHLGQQ